MTDPADYEIPAELEDAFEEFERVVMNSRPARINVFGGTRRTKRMFSFNLYARPTQEFGDGIRGVDISWPIREQLKAIDEVGVGEAALIVFYGCDAQWTESQRLVVESAMS